MMQINILADTQADFDQTIRFIADTLAQQKTDAGPAGESVEAACDYLRGHGFAAVWPKAID